MLLFVDALLVTVKTIHIDSQHIEIKRYGTAKYLRLIAENKHPTINNIEVTICLSL